LERIRKREEIKRSWWEYVTADIIDPGALGEIGSLIAHES